MKHLIFPTKTQADEFIQDLQNQGIVQKSTGTTDLNRPTSSMGTPSSSTLADTTLDGGTPEDAGEGAVRGTGAGVVAGAIAGVVATIATGGLFAPVILGMAALGSGVGAAVGAAGGAMGVDETATDSSLKYDSNLTDDQYNRIHTGVSGGGYPVAVDDTVPMDVVTAAAQRHGGEMV